VIGALAMQAAKEKQLDVLIIAMTRT